MSLKFKEEDIKKLILEKKRVFGDLGESVVVFEKAILRGNTICDCLIFSRKKGIIGVEIKTERDTTRRLNKQLRDYSRVCDYVYVLCHDNHVGKVSNILSRYKHQHVGIISYTEWKGEPMLGRYKDAASSPDKSAFQMMDMLWKTEIVHSLGAFKHYGRYIQEEYGVRVKEDPHWVKGGGANSALANHNPYGSKTRKSSLIVTLIKKLGGEQEATRFVCDLFIRGDMDPGKSLKYYHFLLPENRGPYESR